MQYPHQEHKDKNKIWYYGMMMILILVYSTQGPRPRWKSSGMAFGTIIIAHLIHQAVLQYAPTDNFVSCRALFFYAEHGLRCKIVRFVIMQVQHGDVADE